MELLNGTENRIKELDKNVWGYCIMTTSIQSVNSLIQRVNSLIKSPENFDTELKTIQTDFDTYKQSLNFLSSFSNKKNIIEFNNVVKDAKNQIEINKLKSYIDDYEAEHQNLINIENCSEDANKEQLKIIMKKYELVTNHHKSFNAENLSIANINKINELNEMVKNITTQIMTYLKICEKNKIIKDGNYKVVNNTELIKNALYYRYDSATKTVILLGQYKGDKLYNFSNEKSLIKFKFENNGETVEIDVDKEFLIKEQELLPGGKPRRTRRHKNKKRRSSKQQKSKK